MCSLLQQFAGSIIAKISNSSFKADHDLHMALDLL